MTASRRIAILALVVALGAILWSGLGAAGRWLSIVALDPAMMAMLVRRGALTAAAVTLLIWLVFYGHSIGKILGALRDPQPMTEEGFKKAYTERTQRAAVIPVTILPAISASMHGALQDIIGAAPWLGGFLALWIVAMLVQFLLLGRLRARLGLVSAFSVRRDRRALGVLAATFIAVLVTLRLGQGSQQSAELLLAAEVAAGILLFACALKYPPADHAAATDEPLPVARWFDK